MIKPLVVAELELLAPLFQEVAAEVPAEKLPQGLNMPHVVETWRALMEANLATTWAAFADGKVVGSLGGLFLPEFFTGARMAMEQWFFVLKAHRTSRVALSLWKAFEAEAAKREATTLWAGASRWHDPDRMARWYERQGLEPWNLVFRKVLG
jgi:GNAT superfamily N-acetyltransferase